MKRNSIRKYLYGLSSLLICFNSFGQFNLSEDWGDDTPLAQKEGFNIKYTTRNENAFVVGKLDSNDTEKYGVYDFEKGEFIISPQYSRITKRFYKDNLIECKHGDCYFYFEVYMNGKRTYLTSNFIAFTPNWLVSANYLNHLDCDNYGLEGVVFKILPADSTDKDYQYFRKNQQNIKYKLDAPMYNCYESEPFNYYGFTYSISENFEIVGMYSFGNNNPDEKPFYGLKYVGKNYFLIPSFIDKIEFNKTEKSIDIVYDGKSNSISLERYETK